MKIHPILRIVIGHPELLADHAAAYGALVGEEASKVLGGVVVKVALFGGAAVSGVLGLLFAGIAVMLRGTLPSQSYPAGWVLWVVPGLFLVAAAVLGFMGRSKTLEKPMDVLKAQLMTDLALLKEAGEPPVPAAG